MPDKEETKSNEPMVDLDTSGPDVSISIVFFSSSCIVSPMIVKIREIYLQGFPRSLKLHHR